MFSLGQLCYTPAARDFLEENGVHVGALLKRHVRGDWGDMSAHDKALNDWAAKDGESRIFSSYNVGDGKVWIITEWDRSITTILLPEDY